MQPGTQLGSYEILSAIGTGGMRGTSEQHIEERTDRSLTRFLRESPEKSAERALPQGPRLKVQRSSFHK